MKILLTIALLAFMGCNSQPTQKQVIEMKCKELFNNVSPFIIEEWIEMPVSDSIIRNGVKEECPCNEIINCNGADYCYSNKCSDGTIVPNF
ncbi:MAG: hypothetical protein LBC75_04780 [Fibromonadaceae bacterium]|jgi:hypothetical protein|nr:hypothetical protein [Fibromonadaceae bacterium]